MTNVTSNKTYLQKHYLHT